MWSFRADFIGDLLQVAKPQIPRAGALRNDNFYQLSILHRSPFDRALGISTSGTLAPTFSRFGKLELSHGLLRSSRAFQELSPHEGVPL